MELILCTVANEENAKLIARTLVEEKLAACVNISTPLTSIYFWKDKIVEDAELLLIIKTKKQLFKKIENRVKELHTYEVPEIISLEVKEGSKEYLDWAEAAVCK
ncbi:MAG: divalent-cation tolerance protein CutA [Heliobacteriaceae bacterium]|jgi:periplasmic divalent cation tolerance protein|nr:divalent-cation tolerance protein CutA [Heliobacteriaceae bacterium]